MARSSLWQSEMDTPLSETRAELVTTRQNLAAHTEALEAQARIVQNQHRRIGRLQEENALIVDRSVVSTREIDESHEQVRELREYISTLRPSLTEQYTVALENQRQRLLAEGSSREDSASRIVAELRDEIRERRDVIAELNSSLNEQAAARLAAGSASAAIARRRRALFVGWRAWDGLRAWDVFEARCPF